MPPMSTTGGVRPVEPDHHAELGDLPVSAADLEKLARWVPKKEMVLLVEICDRAKRDPDLARPALLLCSAYAKRVARMLDQDPFPAVTQRIEDWLQRLRAQSGL